ncbi:uncharacterized protein LOC108624917 isoform X1 [Ceratina calcarata]|uniref:Uncharacterized protein LOC108624917 isoform X1 n=1 Tax=Ceratina calcarata TaxID=156304 RepID=A0AAJ7WAQ0_9HYME|nr:uncharacterized protein LOC108624917 isoform X1 [Ceratina calcarata]
MLPRATKPIPEVHRVDIKGDGNGGKKRRSRLVVDCLRRRPSFVLLLLPAALVASLYIVSSEDDFAQRYQPFYRPYNATEERSNVRAQTADGYLVWSSRCQMLSKDPLDSSIRAYVKKEKFEKCTTEPLITGLSREENGTVVLFVDPAALKHQPGLECCWSPVYRSDKQPKKPTKDNNIDSSIVVKKCENLEGKATVPKQAYATMVSCKSKSKSWKKRGKPIYENVHAILDVEKVRDRFKQNSTGGVLSRKLSVLLLGIDSVSRLNFIRSVPNTERYLKETGWVQMNGYNKMGDNTFPNLMAILTGQNQAQAYSICKPTVSYKLDQCSFIWRNFRDAGYVTAYGEDETSLNTFNYLKMGFVEPPTDYYLRPYMLACEKLLKVKKRFGLKYCTGPESSFDRILDYAIEFARAFFGLPYFGFFWTISVSHENANGLSSMDGKLLGKLKQLEQDAVLNDTVIVLLSDHGMRWGPIRNTFVGWYEERLPFLYLWLPEWFRAERPEAYSSLLANQHRLTSPFDLYETLREVLNLSGGQADPAPGCPNCHSLIGGPVPRERGCSDAGISSHWCACTAFEPADPDDPIVRNGVQTFLDHVDKLLDAYRDKKGRRLCAKLRLKKLYRVDRVIDFGNSSSVAYFYMIQVAPGDGKFEVTVNYHENGTYTVSDHEVSRLNQYASSADCLDRGMKQYCHCLK